jgi:hydrogenase expression/formation protein HypC
MCLAVPGKIIEIKDNKTAVIDYIDEKREANCSLLDCKIGEYVIISNGMVIDKIPENEAIESLKMYKDAVKN